MSDTNTNQQQPGSGSSQGLWDILPHHDYHVAYSSYGLNNHTQNIPEEQLPHFAPPSDLFLWPHALPSTPAGDHDSVNGHSVANSTSVTTVEEHSGVADYWPVTYGPEVLDPPVPFGQNLVYWHDIDDLHHLFEAGLGPLGMALVPPSSPVTVRESLLEVKAFIESLEDVPVAQIPSDSMRCPICWLDFATTAEDEPGYTWSPPYNATAEEVRRLNMLLNMPFFVHMNNDAVKTRCGHLFGKDCLEDVVSGGETSCPMCRGDLKVQEA